jgi:hypothetical protein
MLVPTKLQEINSEKQKMKKLILKLKRKERDYLLKVQIIDNIFKSQFS